MLKKPLLFLSVGYLITSCQTMPKVAEHPATPGLTATESVWLEGVPTQIVPGYNEILFKYGNYINVVRNGTFSHKVEGGTFSFSGDAIANKDVSPKKYFVSVAKDKLGDIYYGYYKKVLERSLTLGGFQAVNDPKSADAIIDFEFVINEQKENKVESELVPVTNYTWSESSSLTAGQSVSGTYLPNDNLPLFTSRGNSASSTRGSGSSTSTSWQSKIKTTTEVSYNRTFVVNAWSLDHSQQIWRLSLKSNGQTSDPRLNFAAIAAFSSGFYGSDSNGEFKYFSSRNDPKIEYVQGNDNALNFLTIKKDQTNILNFDLSKPELFTTRNQFGDSLISIAVRLHEVSLFDKLVKLGYPLDSTDSKGRLLLVAAVENQDAVMVERLLKYGADPRKSYKDGVNDSTPLSRAKQIKNEKIISLLETVKALKEKSK